MILAYAFAALLPMAAPKAGPVAPLPEVRGTVTHRERIALPPNAVLTVSLDRFHRDAHENLTELRIRLDGKQVPVGFRLPYSTGSLRQGAIYGVRAEIRAGDRILFESPRHAMVIANGRRQADLVLVRAVPAPSILEVDWELFWMDGAAVTQERPPTLRFDTKEGRLGGSTGVNRFGGNYKWSAPSLQVRLGAMTKMASTPERMAVESTFIRLLGQVSRVELFEGELTLFQGDAPRLRFRKASP